MSSHRACTFGRRLRHARSNHNSQPATTVVTEHLRRPPSTCSHPPRRRRHDGDVQGTAPPTQSRTRPAAGADPDPHGVHDCGLAAVSSSRPHLPPRFQFQPPPPELPGVAAQARVAVCAGGSEARAGAVVPEEGSGDRGVLLHLVWEDK